MYIYVHTYIYKIIQKNIFKIINTKKIFIKRKKIMENSIQMLSVEDCCKNKFKNYNKKIKKNIYIHIYIIYIQA